MSCFDTDEFAFKDLKLNIVKGTTRPFGNDGFKRLQGFSYSTSVEKETLYGTGGVPVSSQQGRITISGTMRITQSELQKLEATLGKSILLAGCFTLFAIYKVEGSSRLQDITIKNVSFTEYEEAINDGDLFALLEIPFMATGTTKVLTDKDGNSKTITVGTVS